MALKGITKFEVAAAVGKVRDHEPHLRRRRQQQRATKAAARTRELLLLPTLSCFYVLIRLTFMLTLKIVAKFGKHV